jgi:hypothetical protein
MSSIVARTSLLALLTAVMGASAACTNALDVHTREQEADHDVAFVAQDDDLLASLDIDDEGWSTTAELERDEPFGRVALRFDAIAGLRVQARARGAAGWSAWQDVTVTYTDQTANNAHLDVEAGSTAAQVRFDAPDAAALSFLVVETFTLEPVVEDGTPDVEVATPEDVTQGLAADGVVVTRAQWGARARSCDGSHSPNRMTVHHTDTPNNDSITMAARVRQIQSYHIDTRGWCDIGYHFLIGQDGKVYQGRVETKVGAHAANDNTNNVGISFVGTYETTVPTTAVMDAGAKIIKALSTTYGIALNRTKIKGHRQVGTTETTCPGEALYTRLQTLIDKASAIGAAPAPTPPPATPPSTTTSFTDVPSTHFAFTAIEKLKARGIVNGCTATTFCPNSKLTRGEMATMFARLLSGDVSYDGVSAYTDVPSAIRADVREAVARDVMGSCSTGGFCHAGSVTRASMAVYAVRATGMGNLDVSRATFSDVSTSYWASGAVERLYQRQVVSGCRTAPLAYCPADDVTRAEAAVILVKAFNL